MNEEEEKPEHVHKWTESDLDNVWCKCGAPWVNPIKHTFTPPGEEPEDVLHL